MGKNEYPLFKELNRWTITKPIANINSNELSDIEVEVHYINQGRKVTGLFFTAKYKKGRRPTIRIEQIVGEQNINPLVAIPMLMHQQPPATIAIAQLLKNTQPLTACASSYQSEKSNPI
nr:replication initiation protein [Moraxella ovis]